MKRRIFRAVVALLLALVVVGCGAMVTGAETGDVLVNGSVETADGQPAANDGIIAFVEGGPAVGEFYLTETDENGEFELGVSGADVVDLQYYQNFPAGEHDVAFPVDRSPDVYALERIDLNRIDGPIDTGTHVLPEAHETFVTVVDESGDPVEDAAVTIEHRNRVSGAVAALSNVTTDANGEMHVPFSDGPGLETVGNVTVIVSPPMDGLGRFLYETHVRSLTVDELTVLEFELASPSPPIAVIDAPNSVSPDETVVLDAAHSWDPDNSAMQYEWVQLDGPSAPLSDPRSVTPVITTPSVDYPTELTFELTVTNGYALQDTERITLVVDPSATNGEDIGVGDGVPEGTSPSVSDTEPTVSVTAVTDAVVRISITGIVEDLPISASLAPVHAPVIPVETVTVMPKTDPEEAEIEVAFIEAGEWSGTDPPASNVWGYVSIDSAIALEKVEVTFSSNVVSNNTAAIYRLSDGDWVRADFAEDESTATVSSPSKAFAITYASNQSQESGGMNDTRSDATSERTDDGTPGFGFVVGFVALLLAYAVAHFDRRGVSP